MRSGAAAASASSPVRSSTASPRTKLPLAVPVANVVQHLMRTLALEEHHAGSWASDGFLSSKRWLCHHTGLSAGASETLDGTWRLDGTLAPGDGKLLDEAIQQHLRPMLAARQDGDPSVEPLTVAEMRAQCLVDIADRDLRDPLPAKARNNRHRINLIVHRNTDGTITPNPDFPEEAWCDATFVRMVLGANSEPLDVGRATRNWPDPIANAIYTRDDHCRFPGCDIAANRCDIHHRTEWQHGGRTNVENGLLLCRRHHRFLHTNHWSIDPDPGGRHPVFRRSDGSTFTQPPSRRPAEAPRLVRWDR